MKKLTKKLLGPVQVVILAILLSAGASYVYAAGSYVEPGCAPTGCNADAPINIGSVGQIKGAGLTLGADSSVINGLIVLNGNVGIGTASPANYPGSHNIAVAGTVGGNIDFLTGASIIGEIGNDANYLYILGSANKGIKIQTGGAITRLTVDSTGGVGINTTANIVSTLKLGVNGNVGASSYCKLDGTSCFTADQVGTGGSSPLTTKGDIYTRSSTADTRLPTGTQGQVLSVDTTTTTGLKWIASPSGGITGTGTNGKLTKWTGVTSVGNSIASEAGTILTVTGTVKITGGTPGVGKVLTGTNALGDANWQTPVAGGIVCGGTCGTNYVPKFNAAGNVIQSQIYDGGTNVGIGFGSTLPGYKLGVNGTIQASGFFYSSDRTLKTNIAPLQDSLARVLKLQGVSFNWKKDATPSVGLVAQDVEKVYPELVSTDPNTGLKSVQYGNLVAPLIESIKAQQKEIEDLKAEINNLQSKK